MIGLAWRERKIVVAHRGTFDGTHDTIEPPSHFVVYQLGFAIPYEPPSLVDTCELAACVLVDASPRPPTHSDVVAGEALIFSVAVVGSCIANVMRRYGLRS